MISTAYAGHVQENGSGDSATFEAITGDSPDEDRTVWDSFYKSKGHVAVLEVVGFIKDNIPTIPKGKAFVPAMGEGRNAIYLAKRGYAVDGVDLSEVAVEHAIKNARDQKVKIKGIPADLNDYRYPDNYYDVVVVSLFYIADLMPRFRKSLKKGGVIILYEKVDNGKNTNKSSPDDFLVKTDELRNALKGMDIKIFKEYKDNGDDVVGVLAKKL